MDVHKKTVVACVLLTQDDGSVQRRVRTFGMMTGDLLALSDWPASLEIAQIALGRTLLYTAFTRARQLVVIVGQRKALSMAVRDWRRAPRYTALGGLLDGTLRLAWVRERGGEAEADEGWWDGLVGGDAAAT